MRFESKKSQNEKKKSVLQLEKKYFLYCSFLAGPLALHLTSPLALHLTDDL